MTLAGSLRIFGPRKHYGEASPFENWYPYTNIGLDDGVMLQFAKPSIEFLPQHHWFLDHNDHFDGTYTWIIPGRGIERLTKSS